MDIFVDARSLLLRARSLKDMEELECLRFVTDIVDIVFQMTRAEWLRPEATERDIAARCREFLISRGFAAVEDVMGAAGANSLLPRGLPTDHAVREGELTLAEIICERLASADRIRFTNSGTEGTMIERQSPNKYNSLKSASKSCWKIGKRAYNSYKTNFI